MVQVQRFAPGCQRPCWEIC